MYVYIYIYIILHRFYISTLVAYPLALHSTYVYLLAYDIEIEVCWV